MEKTLQLEWEKDPAGYRSEERQEGDQSYVVLVPKSGRLERYSHNFDKTNLFFLELTNAVSGARRPSIRHQNRHTWIDNFASYAAASDAAPELVRFANKWGLPNVHHEARVEEFWDLGSRTVWVLNLLAFERLSRDPSRTPRETEVLVKWVNRIRGFFDEAAPTLPALGPERIEADAIYELPTTLGGYCQHEFIRAFETLKVPLGKCHYCERLFARRIRCRKGEREFCPTPRDRCRHAFHNRDLGRWPGRRSPNHAA